MWNPVGVQVTMGEKHTKASDVFAFGMIMYEVLTWTQPWGDLNPFQACSLSLAFLKPARIRNGAPLLLSLVVTPSFLRGNRASTQDQAIGSSRDTSM